MSDIPEVPEVRDRLVELLTAAFTDARNKAGEELSPWVPEGFAVIATNALVGEGVFFRDQLEQVENVARSSVDSSLRASLHLCVEHSEPMWLWPDGSVVCFYCQVVETACDCTAGVPVYRWKEET